MQGIDMRLMLKRFLDECEACDDYYRLHVEMLREEGTLLTNAQVEAILIELNNQHQGHDVQ